MWRSRLVYISFALFSLFNLLLFQFIFFNLCSRIFSDFSSNSFFSFLSLPSITEHFCENLEENVSNYHFFASQGIAMYSLSPSASIFEVFFLDMRNKERERERGRG